MNTPMTPPPYDPHQPLREFLDTYAPDDTLDDLAICEDWQDQIQRGETFESCECPYEAIEWVCGNIFDGRWPSAEPLVLQTPGDSFNYAYNIIDGRWPEAESIILTNSAYASMYSIFCIRGPWPEAESIIAECTYCAFRYATKVLKRRWPEVEERILNSSSARQYREAFNLFDTNTQETTV